VPLGQTGQIAGPVPLGQTGQIAAPVPLGQTGQIAGPVPLGQTMTNRKAGFAVNDTNELTWREWERVMRAERYSPATIEKHRRGLGQLAASAGGRDLLALKRADVQNWIIAMDGWAPSSVLTRFSSARAFYNWAEAEDLIGRSPMYRMKAPINPPVLVELPEVGDVRALLAACRGKDYESKRDQAMIRVMCEAGAPRASETAAIKLAHLDLANDAVSIIGGKGGKSRVIPLSASTATACSRYLRLRARHPKAERCAELWIGNGGRGTMTRSGVGAMLARRCAQAGVPPIHPHQLRHLAAHRFFLAGGREGDAMRLFGWDDPTMPRHYAAIAAATRAQDAARVMALGDEL
jgi:site-specific recombinase XerD